MAEEVERLTTLPEGLSLIPGPVPQVVPLPSVSAPRWPAERPTHNLPLSTVDLHRVVGKKKHVF